MSFILDALKKIEQDKRRADGSPVESIAVARSRFGHRQPMLAMVTIAAGSALLTAVAVSFLNAPKGRGDVADTSPGAEVATSPLRAETTPPVDVEPPRPAASPPAVREVDARTRDPEPERAQSKLKPAVDDDAEVVGDALLGDAASTTSQDIRIVGRERALLDGLSIEDRDRAGDDEAAPEDDDEMSEPLPEGFPDLVLQGTSVIGGDAVAVISDQRVFEGDRIEGAIVLRIGEREVELELEGRRFTLRL